MELFLSTLTFVSGPFIYALFKKNISASNVLDGFIFITIAGIVALHIIPDSLATGGALAILFLVAGLLFPSWIEQLFRQSFDRAHQFILIIATAGLILHALIDGLALASENAINPGNSFYENQLALGVIIHRLPVGMAIWWSIRSQFGGEIAILICGLVILSTALTYFGSHHITAILTTPTLGYFQAFVAGSLIHVIAFGISHTHDHLIESDSKHNSSTANSTYQYGVLLGLIVLISLSGIFH
tara:strand:+ start:1015 stop:1743 length:729 start_codon:yes stop_codon:yes gene_type:complete